jgi:hypothetical protein
MLHVFETETWMSMLHVPATSVLLVRAVGACCLSLLVLVSFYWFIFMRLRGIDIRSLQKCLQMLAEVLVEVLAS